MTLHDVTIDEAKLAQLCRDTGVKRLWFFGSITKSTFRPDSDVDVLVELHQPIGLFKLGGLREDLTDLFGRPVHLTTLGSVPEKVRPALLAEAQLQYAG